MHCRKGCLQQEKGICHLIYQSKQKTTQIVTLSSLLLLPLNSIKKETLDYDLRS